MQVFQLLYDKQNIKEGPFPCGCVSIIPSFQSRIYFNTTMSSFYLTYQHPNGFTYSQLGRDFINLFLFKYMAYRKKAAVKLFMRIMLLGVILFSTKWLHVVGSSFIFKAAVLQTIHHTTFLNFWIFDLINKIENFHFIHI